MARTRKDYVDNQEFLKEMKLYKAKVAQAEAEGREIPRIPNYIGICLDQIAVGLSRRPNFYNYSYKEEMVQDGVENALRCVTNFDPDKSENPFGYFTQVIYYAFIRRIQAEKKQQYITFKLMGKNLVDESLTEGMSGDSTDANYRLLNDDYVSDFIRDYERGIEEKKSSKKAKQGLEKFYEEEDTDIED